MKSTYCLFIVLNISIANWKKIGVIIVLCCLKIIFEFVKEINDKNFIPNLSIKAVIKIETIISEQEKKFQLEMNDYYGSCYDFCSE